MPRMHLIDTEERAACQPHEVACNALGSVCACPGCGQVQLTLQCVTVRLEADAFRELAALVACAERRLAAPAMGH
jgi:hypothetical protein